MEEYEKRFLELLKCVDFVHKGKVKIQCFMSGIPSFYRDIRSYDEPPTLKETIRKAKCMYEKSKGREDMHKAWKGEIKDKQYQRTKGTKPLVSRGNQAQYSKEIPSESKMIETTG